jgi:hypothetical protein
MGGKQGNVAVKPAKPHSGDQSKNVEINHHIDLLVLSRE